MADIDTTREEMNEMEEAKQRAENVVDNAVINPAAQAIAAGMAENANNQNSSNSSDSHDANNPDDDNHQNIDSENTDGNNLDNQNNDSQGTEGKVENQQNQNTASQENQPDENNQNENKKDDSDKKDDNKESATNESKKENENKDKTPTDSKKPDGSEKASNAAEKATDAADKANKSAELADKVKDKISDGVQGAKDFAIDKGVDLITGQQVQGGTQGQDAAEVINETDKAIKENVKGAVAIARAAASGGADVQADIQAAVYALKLALKILVAFIAVALGLVFALFIIIVVIIESIGNIISNAFSMLSEAVDSLANHIPPYFKADTEFTMEEQYELIARAFGDGVQSAYQEMMEDVNSEIQAYQNGERAGYEDINEWDEIINYNLAKGRFKGCYTTDNKDASGVMIPGSEVNTFDDVVVRDDEDNDYKLSLPSKAGDAIMPYIGGVNETSTLLNTTYTVDWRGRLDKGLWALNADASTPTPERYATGKESWFNVEKSNEGLGDTIAYQAVSDMAYLVAGYNVSMMEDTIFEMGEEVSQLQLDLSAIKYEIDIHSRIFQHQITTAGALFNNGNWVQAAKEFLDGVFQQDTYFNYDPDEISVNTSSATRMIMQYEDGGTKDFYGKEWSQTFTITTRKFHSNNGRGEHGDKDVPITCAEANCVAYRFPTLYTCSGGHTKKVLRTCSDASCPGYEDTPHEHTITVSISASSIASSYDSTTGNLTGTAPNFASTAATRTAQHTNIRNSYAGSTIVGDTYSNNESAWTYREDTSDVKHAVYGQYVPKEVQYNESKLDIPMSPFDCDKMMKMLFETSPYYTEITKYYTDEELSYNVISATDNKNPIGQNVSGYVPKQIDGTDDEVLEYYGRYIAEWKYCYFDNHEIDYSGYPAGIVKYNKGDLYDNGIDSQPYFTLDEVYLYDCDCDPHFGMATQCPSCGAGIVRSSQIGSDAGNAAAEGERPVSAMANPMVHADTYFGLLNAAIQIVSGGTVNPMDWVRQENQTRKENQMMVRTTSDKTVLDNYTGDQVGGNIGPNPGAIEVVLTRKNSRGDDVDYYPITVEDRVLELKDAMLNILENTDTIQGIYSAIGLSYGEMLSGEGGAYIDGSGVDEYVYENQNFTASDFSHIDTSNGVLSVGIANFTGNDASKVVTDGMNNNPGLFATPLSMGMKSRNTASNLYMSNTQKQSDSIIRTSDNLTKDEFGSNWSKLAQPDKLDENVSASTVRSYLEKVLSNSKETQKELFKEKVNETVTYLMETCQVTDPATLCLLTDTIVQMKINDVRDIGRAGELSTFRNDVILAGIAAGADNSLDTTKGCLDKWIEKQIKKGNPYVSNDLKQKVNSSYTQVAADKESGDLPWIVNGVAPEDVQGIVDFAKALCAVANKSNTVYGQGNSKYPATRMTGKTCWDAMEKLVNTGQGKVSTDCSAFVQALYWKLGYNVPGSTSAWISGNHQYRARTDMANMIPGDVIIWGKSSGHAELYIGNNQSIGFGSAPPKVHNPYTLFQSSYSVCRYYRVVSK